MSNHREGPCKYGFKCDERNCVPSSACWDNARIADYTCWDTDNGPAPREFKGIVFGNPLVDATNEPRYHLSYGERMALTVIAIMGFVFLPLLLLGMRGG